MTTADDVDIRRVALDKAMEYARDHGGQPDVEWIVKKAAEFERYLANGQDDEQSES